MPPTILKYTHTALDDLPFIITPHDQWLEYVDIFVYDQNAYFGDIGSQDIGILANDSYYIPHPVNLKDLFFKNIGAGLNTRIILVGTPYRGE